jgi:hypothetical protein
MTWADASETEMLFVYNMVKYEIQLEQVIRRVLVVLNKIRSRNSKNTSFYYPNNQSF